MTRPTTRRRTRGALLLAAVLPLISSAAVNASVPRASSGTGEFPFRFSDCVGLWDKTYAPRGGLEDAVPDRYQVYAGQSNGTVFDEVTSLAYGNLYIQTDRCVDGEGRPATISRVSAQVRQPAFDPGQRPVAFPAADKPVGNFWEYYYLLAVVLPEGEAATQELGRYLARRGLPVHVGSVDAALQTMGSSSAPYVTPSTGAATSELDYRVEGVAANAAGEGMHEHVSSYYYDVVGRDGRVRAARMVIDSLTVDWGAACNATATGPRMRALMGGSSNPNGACFHMEGPHTWVDAVRLP